jgi:prevent-host-death family protein
MYSYRMTLLDATPNIVSVTEAASQGIAKLVRGAEEGHDTVVARRGRPVAAMVGMRRLEELRELERDLRDIALILTRAATDTGARSGLDEVITAFGYDRATLEAELDADLAAGRE